MVKYIVTEMEAHHCAHCSPCSTGCIYYCMPYSWPCHSCPLHHLLCVRWHSSVCFISGRKGTGNGFLIFIKATLLLVVLHIHA